MLRHTEIHDGWEIEYDVETSTQWFLRHCERIVMTNIGAHKDMIIKCYICNRIVPDDVLGTLFLCRF